MEKEIKLSAGAIINVEIFLENLEDVSGLREGLYYVLLDYLSTNIDSGVDRRVSGVFIKDFDNLLEFLYMLEARDKERAS